MARDFVSVRYMSSSFRGSGDLQKLYEAVRDGRNFKRSGTNMMTGEKGLRYVVDCDTLADGTQEERAVRYWGSLVAYIHIINGEASITITPHGYFTKQTKAVINAALAAFREITRASVRIEVLGSCISRRNLRATPRWFLAVAGESGTFDAPRWYGEPVNVLPDGTWDKTLSLAEAEKDRQYQEYRDGQKREALAYQRSLRAKSAKETKAARARARRLLARVRSRRANAPLASLKMGEN